MANTSITGHSSCSSNTILFDDILPSDWEDDVLSDSDRIPASDANDRTSKYTDFSGILYKNQSIYAHVWKQWKPQIVLWTTKKTIKILWLNFTIFLFLLFLYAGRPTGIPGHDHGHCCHFHRVFLPISATWMFPIASRGGENSAENLNKKFADTWTNWRSQVHGGILSLYIQYLLLHFCNLMKNSYNK